MSGNGSWQQELASARQRQRQHGGTVWGHLMDLCPAPQEANWRQRMQEMAVTVLAFEPSAAVRRAGCAPEQGFWLTPVDGSAPGLLVLADPWSEEVLDQAQVGLSTPASLTTCSSEDYRLWLAALPRSAVPDREQPVKEVSPTPSMLAVASAQGASELDVIGFVNQALDEAVTLGASDIHFECNRQGLLLKLRVDGVLREVMRADNPQRAQEVISRIKVLAQLDITEQRVPQDGRFRHVLAAGSAMDLRVSIMPSVHGEDAVLRLLDRAQLRQREASSSLDALAFDTDSVQRIRELGQRPHGMLLVTGPTGSGKTTTVYGVLSELNSGTEKIITIEDPVEYELPGVLQIPVNERKGLSFAKGLRSILRHDPDRILVGEIRDADTAEIAVQSALTGHQVFTTVHANSLFDVTGRFKHFGLDMFGFMSALNGIVVQRLVRALCGTCVSTRESTPREQAWLGANGQSSHQVVPKAMGCSSCGGTGYRRRFVIAEVHEVDDTLRDLVTGQQSIAALREHVRRSGVRSLAEVAAEAVALQRTSMEEVQRVVGLG
jgi:general secretion pathway protein E